MKLIRRKRGGVVLLLSLGVLFLLVVIGLIYIDLTRTGLATSIDFVDETRAIFLADSGVEYAINALQYIFMRQAVATPQDLWIYFGEDLNRNYSLDSNEDRNSNGKLDVITCPVEDALMPSLPYILPIYVEGRPKIISGALPSTYHANLVGDPFILKIVDTSARICVNNFENTQLERILNNLGRILGIPRDIGTIIKQNKPDGGRYIYYLQLEKVLGKDDFARIRPYITLYCWEDNKVIEPAGQRFKPGTEIFTYSQLTPGILKLSSRAPVNINLAEAPVIEALLTDISGVYVEEDTSGLEFLDSDEHTDKMRNAFVLFLNPIKKPQRIGVIRSVSISAETAKKVTEEIIKRRKEKANLSPPQALFYTWLDFHNFLLELVDKKIIDDLQADLIMANFNPNTDLNKFNPNLSFYRRIDKSDLSSWSTEFIFIPSGIFEIESFGIILDKKTNIRAAKKVEAIVKIYDIFRETTQNDFTSGNYFISNFNLLETDNGKSLQIYPEPDIVVLQTKGYQDKFPNLSMDGYLALSTINNKDVVFEDKSFYVSFYKNLDADVADGDPKHVEDWKGRPNTNSLFNTSSPGSLYPDGAFSEKFSTLLYKAKHNFPELSLDKIMNNSVSGKDDEFKGQWGSTPIIDRVGFDAKRVLRGTLSFWIKPAFSNKSDRIRVLFSVTRFLSNIDSTTQTEQTIQAFNLINFFQLFYIPPKMLNILKKYDVYAPVWFWEHPMVDEFIWGNKRQTIHGWPTFKEHIWTHIAISWDTLCGGNTLDIPDMGKCCRLYVDGEDVTKEIFYKYVGVPGRYSGSIDYTTDNLLRFGTKFNDPVWNFPADATFDEIIIAKFQREHEEIKSEFERGRYYSIGDGFYLSKVISAETIPRTAVYGKVYGSQNTETTYATSTVLGSISWTDNVSFRITEASHRSYSLIQMQITDNNGVELLENPATDPGGTPLGIITPKGFRYKVLFLTSLSEDMRNPLLDTPILDDVTITIINLNNGRDRFYYYTIY